MPEGLALHDRLVRAASGVSVEPVARPTCDQLLHTPCAQLGDTVFVSAWAARGLQPLNTPSRK